MRTRRLGLSTGSVVATATMVLTGSAWAQCEIDCPKGAIQQNDGCADQTPDPNGGCNVVPVAYQDVGSVGTGSDLNVCGTVGTWGAASRDLDWYRFTLDTAAYVQLSVVNRTEGGTGAQATNITLFLLNGDDCNTQVTEFAAASGDCPFSTPVILLPAGNHVFIVTVNAFAPDAPACDVAYVATLSNISEGPASCFTSEQDCLTPSTKVPGCNNFACCAQICNPDTGLPECCTVAWDETCVFFAESDCGIFTYTCDAPVTANDCATAATTLAIDSTLTFNNTGANTDGPPTACDYGADLWYVVKAPDDGELQIDVSSPGWDSTVALYALGITPTFAPENLPSLLIGCVDALGEGGEALVLIDAVADEYYLVQVGGFITGGVPQTGEGDVTATFRRLIYNTGNTTAVQWDAAGGCVYALANLGWSSGKVSATLTERWSAAAFTISDPGAGLEWNVQRINVYGFTPAGVTNETMDYRIYKRTAFTTVPTDADLVAFGSVPFPTPYDIFGGAATENHEIELDINLEAGDYWLTVFAANTLGPGIFANFAWFTNAATPTPSLDGAGDPFQWRSSQYPAPGYAVYTLPDCTLAFSNGINRYSPGFRILGTKTSGGPTCKSDGSADFDQNGCVNGNDLGTLLGLWGVGGGLSIADFNCDGIVDGNDLGTLLGQWGGTCAP